MKAADKIKLMCSHVRKLKGQPNRIMDPAILKLVGLVTVENKASGTTTRRQAMADARQVTTASPSHGALLDGQGALLDNPQQTTPTTPSTPSTPSHGAHDPQQTTQSTPVPRVRPPTVSPATKAELAKHRWTPSVPKLNFKKLRDEGCLEDVKAPPLWTDSVGRELDESNMSDVSSMSDASGASDVLS